MTTPEKLRIEAARMDALMEEFERTYLHFLDMGEDNMEERSRGTFAFYVLRDQLQKIILRRRSCHSEGKEVLTVIEKNPFAKNALEIKSKVHTVRAIRMSQEVLFAASDIVGCCGIKAPTKWVKRAMEGRHGVFAMKQYYPVRTNAGYRNIQMYFVNAACARRIIELTICPEETRRWLTEEVLSYRFDPKDTVAELAKADSPEPEAVEDKPEKEILAQSDISRRIDNILVELLELKNAICRNGSSV